VAATVHGYTVAMAWGVAILVVAAVPAVVLVDAKAPARHRKPDSSGCDVAICL